MIADRSQAAHAVDEGEGRVMSQVLIRDIDPEDLSRLKDRAKRRGRSLQSELKQILERAARTDVQQFADKAKEMRRELAGTEQSDSAQTQAQDRDR